MYITLSVGLLALASSVFADVTYNVVAFPDAATNKYAVEVNEKLYPLRTSEAIFPLWSANVAGVTASANYRYVQLDGENNVVDREGFERQFAEKDATATLNEFFNRQTTITTLPPMKQVYEDVRPKPSKAWDSSQIATIHLTAEPGTFEDMMNNPLDKEAEPIKAGFRFINANTVYSVGEAKLSVSGNSSRKFKKVSLRVKFDDHKGETFFDRPIIKLRAEATDKTLMREKLYVDILNSVGVPTYQGSYARVYVNGEPHGLFLMVEDIEEPFLMNTIHHGSIKDKKQLGSLYQMNLREAPMTYEGPNPEDYRERVYMNKIESPHDKNMQQWIGFMKDLQDFNPAAPGGVEFWSKRLDLDGYLRAMAIEYLAGAWDSFWWRGHNFFMYHNPETKVWQFIPTDFDHTFNNGNRPNGDMPYQNFLPLHHSRKFTARPLVTKLIYKNKDINKKFENILHTITREVFNSEVLDARIDAYEQQIGPEVAWDYSIDRTDKPGKSVHRGFDTFHTAIKGKTIKPKDNTGKLIRGLKPWIAARANRVLNGVAAQ
ncbi:hypothetical protein DFQ27_005080 [Actinomortierella ambigua]|uniref:Coth protein-domain-containing protein n=1 Tax=Actinomortierella ambigua TaxID=1343610 RepID=A0A9P6Q366_9FUNG|nr:hypothetical protein DFQ27_005080 [Actinomortierella ambigua]